MEDFKPSRKSPEDNASLPSRLFFCWLFPLFRKGYRRELDQTDLYQVTSKDESERLTNLLEKEWKLEVQRHKEGKTKDPKPRLKRAIFRAFGRKFMTLGLITLFEEFIKIIQPIFMGTLIRYFRFGGTADFNIDMAYAFALGISVCAMTMSTVHHLYLYSIQRVGMWMKIACCGIVYKKALRLNSSALRATSVGKIVNLMSNDVARFDQVVIFWHFIWVAPISLFAFIGLLWWQMGPSCLAGFGAILVIIPVQGVIGRNMGKFRRSVAGFTDKRVGIMNEILNGIRVVKMYAWEKPFSKIVDEARRNELSKILGTVSMQGLIMGLFYATGKLTVYFAIVAFVLSENPMTADVAFVASAFFNTARLSIALFFPLSMQFFNETLITIERIEDFLMLEEREETIETITNGATVDGDAEKHKAVTFSPYAEMANYCAKWEEGQEAFTLDNISFSVKPGELLMVVGPVGAGKSSVLLSLLGELYTMGGRCRVSGRVAYVPQEAWIYSSSLQANILFNSQLEMARYQRALKVCALKKDLEMMPDGDRTIVGDRGIALSGGQRARVALARAVYSDAEVFLLDDPLSAVDAEVGRFLFEKCVMGALASKVRVLVTHQLQYLRAAKKILLLKEGRAVAFGSFDELQQQLGDTFSSILEQTEASYREHVTARPRIASTSSPTKKRLQSQGSKDSQHSVAAAPRVSTGGSVEEEPGVEKPLLTSTPRKGKEEGQLERMDSSWSLASGVDVSAEAPVQPEEEHSIGAVSWRVYAQFFGAMTHPILVVLLFIFCFAVQAVFNACDWWLNFWASNAEREEFERHNRTNPVGMNFTSLPVQTRLTMNEYIYVYTALVFGLLVFSLIRALIFRYLELRASFNLHQRMFASVIRAPVSFFDRNPIGRILNRFSKDTGTMDEQLSFVTYDFVQGFLQFVGVIVVIGFLNPYVFGIVVPLAGVFCFVRYFYLKTSRNVKRLESSTRSPMFSHISACLNGLTTIRAFGGEAKVIADYHRHQNLYTSAFSLFLSTSRWFGVVIDWLCTAFITLVCIVSVLTYQHMTSGEVGLILFYAVTVTFQFAYNAQQSTVMETAMVSVERILQYAKIEPEGDLEAEDPARRPNAAWPAQGEIRFVHVSVKYGGDDAPDVLKDIDFTIHASEKVGIAGRTGAGKSTLLSVLFRLVPISEGLVEIDGIDLATIGLHDLRKKISIIPQDPVLFIGTLRSNLDPFDEFNDAQIWLALEQVELKPFVQNTLAQALETHMQEGGANLSVGQRQLVCLARALLRHTKVLVVDEATANVDPETDALIQRTIRDRFSDCTVLTIAHRLNTIADMDRIMVLDGGRLVEFASPHALLGDDASLFAKFVRETGAESAERLKAIAAEAARSSLPAAANGEKAGKYLGLDLSALSSYRAAVLSNEGSGPPPAPKV